MADKGIIFAAPMVRALLDGRKTQTRRLLAGVPPPPAYDNVVHEPRHPWPYFDAYCGGKKTAANPRGMTNQWCWWTRDDRAGHGCKVPYVPGDRLYVRETCRAEELDDGLDGVRFTADGLFLPIQPTMVAAAKWSVLFYYRGRGKGPIGNPVPSIHMPRWASRMWLAVTDVRVQRLQDITEADAIAEGMPDFSVLDPADIPHLKPYAETQTRLRWPQRWYAGLWDSLHSEPGTRWADNPWIVAVSFDVHRGNIDG